MKRSLSILLTVFLILCVSAPSWAASSRRLPDAYCVFTYGDGTRHYQVGELSDWEGDTDIDLTAITTVDAASASGQKVLNVASTTPWGGTERPAFQNGDTICIDPDGIGDGPEIVEVNTVQAGVSVTLVANLIGDYSNEDIASGAVLEGYADAASYDDSINVGGATTTVDFFRVLKPATGEEHNGTPDGVQCFTLAQSSAVTTVHVAENYSQVHDIVATNTYSYDGTTYVFELNVSNYGALVGCIAYDFSNADAGDNCDGFRIRTAVPGYVINCASFGGDGNGFLSTQASTTSYFYNCVAYGNAGYGFSLSSGAGTAKNCIAENNTTADWSGNWTKTTCYYSHPGFNDPANGDFLWVDTTWTGWMVPAFATDLSADGTYAFDDDIDGDTRNSWSAGVDDFEGSAGSSRFVGYSENVQTYGLSDVAGCAGGAGCDYTEGELTNWEILTDVNLVSTTTTEALEAYDEATSWDDADDLDGATTSAKYFRIIRPATGEGHDGTPTTGVTFSGIFNSIRTFGIAEDYGQIQDLIADVDFNTATHATAPFWIYNADVGATYVGCISNAPTNAGAGVQFGFTVYAAASVPSATGTFVNCLSIGADAGRGFATWAPAGGTSIGYFYNCTAIDTSTAYANFQNYDTSTGVATATWTNCLSHGSDTADFTSNGIEYVNYCASEDATADDWDGQGGSGDGNQISQTFTFVGAPDYHLAAGDTGAKDLGKDLGVVGLYAHSDDIDGDTRSGTWDIGFDEYIAPGGAVLTPFFWFQ